MDNTFRVPLYRYSIAQAAGEKEEAASRLRELEAMENQEWCWAASLGDIYTLRQEYGKAVEWYRRGQEMQPAPRSHITEQTRRNEKNSVPAQRARIFTPKTNPIPE